MAVKKVNDLERQRNTIRITNPSPRGKSPVAFVMQGLEGDLLNQHGRKSVGFADDVYKRAFDINGNRNLGPVEKGERLRGVPPYKEINAHAIALRTERNRIRSLVVGIDPVESYNKVGLIGYMQDAERRAQNKALTPAERAARVHQMRSDDGYGVALDLNFAEAILRTPQDILMLEGFDAALVNEIRVGVIKVLRPEAYAELSLRMDQLDGAESALRALVDVVYETTGTLQDLLDHAPDAHSLVHGSEAGDVVTWNLPSQSQSSGSAQG